MKIKQLKYLFLFILIPIQIQAQYEFDCSGYLYAVPSYQLLNNSIDFLYPGNNINKNQYSLITKLRLRPILHLWDNARIEAAAETQVIFAKSGMFFFSNDQIYSRQAIDMNWTLYNKGDVDVTELIDRLFFKQTFDDFEITLGRQRINWGVGRVWQPTDRLHPINPANFTKIEKTGADAFSFKYFLGLFTDMEFVVNFREHINNWNYGMRLRTNFSPFDASLILGYFDRQPNIGFDLSGSVAGAGVRAEGIYVNNKDYSDSSYVRFIVGVDYQLTSKIYSLLEFQYNGEGTTCKYCYDVYKVFSGQMMNMGKYYLAGMINWQIHPLIVLSANVMQNFNDGSGYISPIFMYSALENLSLNLGGLMVYSSKRSEFWYYPKTSIYLTAQYFF